MKKKLKEDFISRGGDNLRNIWTNEDFSISEKLDQSFDETKSLVKEHLDEEHKKKQKSLLRKLEEEVLRGVFRPLGGVVHLTSRFFGGYHKLNKKEKKLEYTGPSRMEILERLRKYGFAETKVFAEIVKHKDARKSGKTLGMILLAPTDSVVYDHFRNSVFRGFDDDYVHALFAKMEAESGVSDIAVIKEPTIIEYQAALMASPYIQALAMVGHGNDSSISINYDEFGYSKAGLLFRTKEEKDEYIKHLHTPSNEEISEYYLSTIAPYFKTVPLWEPIPYLFKETCGGEKKQGNTFGQSIASRIYYYDGISTPIQHMVGYWQQSMEGSEKKKTVFSKQVPNQGTDSKESS